MSMHQTRVFGDFWVFATLSNKMKSFIYRSLLLIVVLLLGCVSPSVKVTSSGAPLKQYQFWELDSLMKKKQLPVAVFLHAKWCTFCSNMKQTTLQNEAVVKLLNENYYFLSFDGEQKEDVVFRNHRFQYQATGRNTGTHELATALGEMDGTLTYPTFVLLNSDYEIVFQHNAFLNSKEMIRILEEGIQN